MQDLGICQNCHWLYDRDGERDPLEKDSRGKVCPCINIGVPGWHYWEDVQCAPAECEEYVKKGEYEPTGLWAGVAEFVKEVAKVVDCGQEDT